MKSRIYWALSLIMVLGMVLSACASPAAPTEAPPVDEPTAAAVMEEPTAEPTKAPEPTVEEITAAGPEALDEAFGSFFSSMEGYNTISPEKLAEMMAEDAAPFILDVRQPSEAEEKGTIPGAVLIPLREVGENLDKLPAFDETIVSYCGSGWRCTIAGTALGALGWHNTLSLKGGSYGGWVEAGYETETGMPPEGEALNAAEPDPALVMAVNDMLSAVPDGYGVITVDELATELAENPDLIVMDVRTAPEIEEKGSIEGAIAIPLEELVDRRSEWPQDQEAPIAVYCGSGHRSTMAMTTLWTYDYSNVRSLKDGFAAWAEAGYDVVGGTQPAEAGVDLDSAFQAFLDDMEAYGTIGLADLNAALAEEPPPYVLDVRETSELEEKGYIEGAYHIPLREIAANIDLLPSFDTPIVSYCGSGWRCTIAMTVLEAMGWQDVKSLKEGSFSGWVEQGYPIAEGLPENEPLNAAQPAPDLVAHFNEVLSGIPEGYGVVTIENLATELVENPDLILIDVRRDEELENGVIEHENQVHIPLEQLIEMKDQWPQDMDATIVTYCGSGHRSTIAMTILWSYGYTDVRSMKDGFSGWQEAGYPVAQPEAAQ